MRILNVPCLKKLKKHHGGHTLYFCLSLHCAVLMPVANTGHGPFQWFYNSSKKIMYVISLSLYLFLARSTSEFTTTDIIQTRAHVSVLLLFLVCIDFNQVMFFSLFLSFLRLVIIVSQWTFIPFYRGNSAGICEDKFLRPLVPLSFIWSFVNSLINAAFYFMFVLSW